MNKEIRELTLSAIFLALAIVLSLIQIPFIPDMGLSFDFSYVALLIGRRYIGLTKTIVLAMIYPWFTMYGFGQGSIIGALFLFLQAIFVVIVDYIFMKNKVSIHGILLSILLITIWSIVLNVFLIGPMYHSTFADYYNNFWAFDAHGDGNSGPTGNAILWFIISLLFNPIKFMMVYVVIYYLLPKLIKEGITYE